MTNLNQVPVGKSAEILKINIKEPLKQRLLDIGLIPGSRIKVLHKSPSGNPRGYLICGAVIALRNEDAENIIAKVAADSE